MNWKKELDPAPCWNYVEVILGLCWGYIGLHGGYIGLLLRLHWGNIGFILGLYRKHQWLCLQGCASGY